MLGLQGLVFRGRLLVREFRLQAFNCFGSDFCIAAVALLASCLSFTHEPRERLGIRAAGTTMQHVLVRHVSLSPGDRSSFGVEGVGV